MSSDAPTHLEEEFLHIMRFATGRRMADLTRLRLVRSFPRSDELRKVVRGRWQLLPLNSAVRYSSQSPIWLGLAVPSFKTPPSQYAKVSSPS